jgi:hypothetical protein
MKITILQRPGQFTAKDFNRSLEDALHLLKGELSASTKINGFSRKGWARIELDGADYEILSELIAREFGQAQTDLAKVEPNGVYDGIIAGEVHDNLEVDIGIDTPRQINVKIALGTLRAQLADGKPLRGSEIIQDYCLFPGSRASVRISRLEPDSGVVEGWFADSQISLLSSWVATGLDRIQIYDSYRREIESAIKKSHLARDLVSLESITLTTHSIVCKLGTDAVGLIPKLGSVLRKRELSAFLPKRVIARCRPW